MCYNILQVPIDCCWKAVFPDENDLSLALEPHEICEIDLLSGRCHPTKILPAGEEVLKPAVVTHDPVNYSPPTADDLSRQQHDEMQETTELHPE